MLGGAGGLVQLRHGALHHVALAFECKLAGAKAQRALLTEKVEDAALGLQRLTRAGRRGRDVSSGSSRGGTRAPRRRPQLVWLVGCIHKPDGDSKEARGLAMAAVRQCADSLPAQRNTGSARRTSRPREKDRGGRSGSEAQGLRRHAGACY